MGQTEKDFTHKVRLEKLLTNGVIQEGAQDIEGSYARQEFIQAFGVLKQILLENYGTDCGSDMYDERMNTGRRREIFNVIPFLGERGTGKTSTMLSFAHMLATFDAGKKVYTPFLTDEEDWRGNGGGAPKFVVLQYIDVGVLKNKEDIMAIILARMLKYVQKVINKGSGPEYGVQAVRQEELRQLYQRFEEVYQDLLNLTQENPNQEVESALRKLQNLNSSHSLAEKFQKLVGLFLRFLSRNDESSCRYYLVILLDDIDLIETAVAPSSQVKKKDAYTILGQMYEYLQIPGVVVLTTFDESKLIQACRAHIKEVFPYLTERECVLQAVQYIQKVILPKYKIYLTNLNYIDYPKAWQLSIVIGSNTSLYHVLFPNTPSGETTGVKARAVNEEKMAELTPKELILVYLANVYGCYFDTMGKKQHFFEERTLRRIKNLFLALRTGDGTPFAKADEALREQRYMRLMSYVYNQFIGEKLDSPNERTLIQEWLSMPVERRSKEILSFIRSKRSELDANSPYYWATGGESTYSYGELIHNLYYSSRCDIFSKEMVHCILASYSLTLPRLYQGHRLQNKEGAGEAYHALRCVLGTSIAGRWSNEILYTTFFVDSDLVMGKTRYARIGSISTGCCDQAYKVPITGKWEWGIRWALDENNNRLEKPKTEALKNSFEEFLHIIEILGMFFTNVRSRRREEQKEWKRANYGFRITADGEEKAEEGPIEIGLSQKEMVSSVIPRRESLKPTSRYACFNILNFVVNSFTWEEYFDVLHSSLLDAMLAWRSKNESRFTGLQERTALKKKVKQYSLEKKFKKWADDFGTCAIPFQHFDLTYNILKRQRDTSDHGLPEQENVRRFYNCCESVFDNICDALGEQDDFFEKYYPSNFKSAFKENPFISQFKKFRNNDDFLKLFTDLAKTMVREEDMAQRDILIKQY